MVYYRRRYPYRRKSYRRKSYRSRTKVIARPAPQSDLQAALQTGRAAWSLATKMYGMINSELKHFDATPVNTTVGTTATIASLCPTTQGDADNTFQGNSIMAKSIQINYRIGMSASATSTRVLIAVVLDTRPVGGSVPAFTDIFANSTTFAFLNIDDQIGRFRVLYRRTHMMSINQTSQEVQRKIYRKLGNLHVKYNDAQGVTLNNLLIVALSDEATNTPMVTVSSRIRYYDN